MVSRLVSGLMSGEQAVSGFELRKQPQPQCTTRKRCLAKRPTCHRSAVPMPVLRHAFEGTPTFCSASSGGSMVA